MVRNMEKLLKIERPKRVCSLKLNTIDVPLTLTLDLVNIEPCTEPVVTVNVDLGLDQLEETEE